MWEEAKAAEFATLHAAAEREHTAALNALEAKTLQASHASQEAMIATVRREMSESAANDPRHCGVHWSNQRLQS